MVQNLRIVPDQIRKTTNIPPKNMWKRILHLMQWHQTPRKGEKYADKITLENLCKANFSEKHLNSPDMKYPMMTRDPLHHSLRILLSD